MIGLIESVAPVVKNSAADTEVSRELDDVAARIHSFNGLLSKFFAVSLLLLLLHFALLSHKVCTTELSHSRSHSKPRQQEQTLLEPIA